MSANGLLDHGRRVLQHSVAGVVADGVVDFLEAVEIDEQQREAMVADAPTFDGLRQKAREAHAVGQAGQLIAFGEPDGVLSRRHQFLRALDDALLQPLGQCDELLIGVVELGRFLLEELFSLVTRGTLAFHAPFQPPNLFVVAAFALAVHAWCLIENLTKLSGPSPILWVVTATGSR